MPSAAVIALDLLAHELRNAANIVVNGAQLLADDADTDIASDVERSGRELAVLIDRLIVAARSELGAEADSADSVSVDQLCKLALRRLARTHPDMPGQTLTPGCDDFVVKVHVGAAERAVADAISLIGGPAGAHVSCHDDARWIHVSVAGSTDSVAQGGVPGRLVLLRALAKAAGGKLEQAQSDTITLGFPGTRSSA